jgi:AcrR family transcriptional regulator
MVNTVKMIHTETEKSILRAAKLVFYKKGLAAARMQEIADEANINKAMLHYYFRSKQKLFEAVFLQAFGELAPHLNTIFNSDKPVFEKIRDFVDGYITFVAENPYLPTFIIQEMNINPQFGETFFADHITPDPSVFEKQIAEEIKQGIIKPIDPKQLLLNLISLTAFPFIGKGLVTGILGLDETAFKTYMEERKKLIPEMIINTIKAS